MDLFSVEVDPDSNIKNTGQQAQFDVAVDIPPPDSSASSQIIHDLSVGANLTHDKGDSRIDGQEKQPSSATDRPLPSNHTTQAQPIDEQSIREEKTATPSTRLYFEPEESPSPGMSTSFRSVPDYRPFVKVEEHIDLLLKADIEGLYNIRITVNLNHLKLDGIESILITQYDSDAPEIFTKQELQDHFNKTKDGMLILGLCRRQFKVGSTSYSTLKFEIRSSSQDDPGYIELDHVDLGPSSRTAEDVAISILHQPLLWSIDVKLVEPEGNITDSAPQIIHYAVSGDGKYVVTLATIRKLLQLDVWKIHQDPRSGGSAEDCIERREPFLPTSCGYYKSPLPDGWNKQVMSSERLLKTLRSLHDKISVSKREEEGPHVSNDMLPAPTREEEDPKILNVQTHDIEDLLKTIIEGLPEQENLLKLVGEDLLKTITEGLPGQAREDLLKWSEEDLLKQGREDLLKGVREDLLKGVREDLLKRAREDLRISVSYDASMIILMCADRGVRSKRQGETKKYSLLEDTFQAFTFKSKTSQEELPPMKDDDLGKHFKYFREFGGFGKFHCTSLKDRSAKDEVFITCDRRNINIFNVAGKWEHIRQICHAGEHTLLKQWHAGVEGIGGKHIMLRNKDSRTSDEDHRTSDEDHRTSDEDHRTSDEDHRTSNKSEEIMSIYDLETGKLVNAMLSHAVARLSSLGCLMLCYHKQGMIYITTQWANSEVVLATLPVEVDVLGQVSVEFIGNGSRILVFPVKSDPGLGRRPQGIILDSTTLAIVDRVSYPTGFTFQRLSTVTLNQYLYSVNDTRLESVRLQDVVMAPYPHSRSLCDTQCVKKLEDPRWDLEKTAITVGSGLTITVVVVEEGSVVVSISSTKDDKNDKGKSNELLRIPPLNLNFTQEEELSGDSKFWSILRDLKKSTSDPRNQQAPNPKDQLASNASRQDLASRQEYLRWRVHVDKASLQLIVDCERCVIVWELPATLEGTVTLQTAFWTTEIYHGKDSIYQNHKMPNRTWRELKKCSHGRTYAVLTSNDVKGTVRNLRCELVFGCDPHLFFDGLFVLIVLFDRGDDAFKKAIMQYIRLYINRAMTYKLKRVGRRGELEEDFPETVMAAICRSANKSNYTVINTFLKELLKPKHVRWVPTKCQDIQRNPIVQLLRNAYKYPIVINLARIMIDYCINMAKEEKDWYFMVPVLGLFSMDHIAGELKELPPDLIPKILETIAYFPVKEKSFVINHGIMIHPPRKHGKPIYAHKDPILQLDDSTLYKEYSSLNDNTTRDLYVASFDLLWLKKTQDTRSSIERIKSVRPPWWPDILFHLFLLKFKLKPLASVVCNNFSLEMLDNPAISAMIEYKWNTIGYLYWVSRFFCQCVFNVLVLVAVFMQVYDATEYHSLKGVFITIIVMASFFLLLEVHQFFSNPRRYITDLYNVVDIAAFAFPLAGSALQIINIRDDDAGGDISTLSFSVLFIFLHTLFELRVIKSVCHFVAIIVSIISKIRVFFFIFVAGILAFTAAVLHLLHGCPVGDCSKKTENLKFPKDFHLAFSTTYFFMGGIWDSVGGDLEKGSWTFHIMMILYFFFTSILLLNVLIAIMNEAFNVGDKTWLLTWKQCRLRRIEQAETITYNIPGLREHYPLFPDKIYYFASDKEQKEYRAKYFPVDLEDIKGNQDDLKKRYEEMFRELKQQQEAKPNNLKQQHTVKHHHSLKHRQEEKDEEFIHQLQKKIDAVEKQLQDMKQLMNSLQPEQSSSVIQDQSLITN
ncbi:MAG: hypothetical protein J3Q66DRAFT_352823 [Benniella sp.]|nr:MAG: hypothetical protein J3Q66DRAFT_352823 [Benniella sp.]